MYSRSFKIFMICSRVSRANVYSLILQHPRNAIVVFLARIAHMCVRVCVCTCNCTIVLQATRIDLYIHTVVTRSKQHKLIEVTTRISKNTHKSYFRLGQVETQIFFSSSVFIAKFSRRKITLDNRDNTWAVLFAMQHVYTTILLLEKENVRHKFHSCLLKNFHFSIGRDTNRRQHTRTRQTERRRDTPSLF